jgi:transposase
MLALSGNSRIFVYQEPMDLRKGFEGLSAIVQQAFCVELTSGMYFA